jgi:hypothetical protein
MASEALVGGIGIISLVAFKTIRSYLQMCSFNDPIIVVNIKCGWFPAGIGRMTGFAFRWNVNSDMGRVLGLSIISSVTSIAGVGGIGKSVRMTFGTFDSCMASCQRINEAMIKTLFFPFGMAGKTIGAVIGIALNSVMFFIHISTIMIVTINASKQGIVGGIGMAVETTVPYSIVASGVNRK